MFIVRIVQKELKYQKMEVFINVHSVLLKIEKLIDEIILISYYF